MNDQLHSERLKKFIDVLVDLSDDFGESYNTNDLYIEDLDIEIHDTIGRVEALFTKYINMIKEVENEKDC